MPDLLDPPTCPNHRDLAHGVLTVGATGAAVWEVIEQLPPALRARADEFATQRQNAVGDFGRAWLQLFEALCRVLAGAVPGFVAGYASHLALDMATLRGLPLIARGC